MKYEIYDIGESRRPYLLTVMAIKGQHPRVTFRAADALYVGKEDLVYTVVGIDPHDRSPFGETHWANIAEIRLWGAIAFAIREGEGFYSFEPGANRVMFLSSINEKTAQRVAEGLAADIPKGERWSRKLTVPESELLGLYDALLNADNILLRGVSCYLKSHLFWGSTLFMEEKAFNLYVSLEAALNTLKRRFSAAQGRDVSYDDVYKFIENTFAYGESLVEYLRDCRDNRNILFHPHNYFGEYVMAPLTADDVMELFDPMLTLYRYILIGDLRPPFDR